MKRALSGGPDDGLLSAADPAPVVTLNPDSDHPVLLVCEHAGQAIPARLGDLGVSQRALNSHIGWDIGAQAVTRAMADLLGAPAVIQCYSRLVIDCNRPPDAPDAIPAISHGTVVAGNGNLDATARALRVKEIFDPFQSAITKGLSHAHRRATFAIHSFTGDLDGRARAWDVGFLYRRDVATSERLASLVQGFRPGLHIGMNQPYRIDTASDWFVPAHAEASGLAHSLIEVRNDHIDTPDGQTEWADLLAKAVKQLIKEQAA